MNAAREKQHALTTHDDAIAAKLREIRVEPRISLISVRPRFYRFYVDLIQVLAGDTSVHVLDL